jgi:hypothetical protein
LAPASTPSRCGQDGAPRVVTPDDLLATLGSRWEVDGPLFEGELRIDATRVVHASAPSQEDVRTSVSISLNDVPKGEDDLPPNPIRLTFHVHASYDTPRGRAPSEAKPSMMHTESWPMVLLWCLCFGLFVLLGGFKEGAPVGRIAFEATGIGLAIAGAVLVAPGADGSRGGRRRPSETHRAASDQRRSSTRSFGRWQAP